MKIINIIKSLIKDYVPIAPTVNGSSKYRWYMGNEAYYDAYKSIVYACMNVRAKSVANIGQKNNFRVYQQNTIDEFIDVGVNDPLRKLLHNPNPYLTRFQFWYLTSIYLDLFGNSYWLVNKIKGVPVSLWILKPENIKIIPSNNGKSLIEHYEYKEGTTIKKYSEQDIIHIKYPNPRDPYFYGCGIVEKSLSEIDIDDFISDFQRTYFENDTTPPAVITFPNILNEKVRRAFEDNWLNKFKRKAGQIAVLEGGADVKVLGNDKEISYIQTYQENRKKLQAIFGVPDSKLGYSETITAKATLETIDYNFYKETIEPILTLIDEQLTKDLGKLFGSNYIVLHESSIPKDKLLQADIDERELRMGKVSINEVRMRDGYDPIVGGEEPMVNLALSPLTLLRGIKQTEINI